MKQRTWGWELLGVLCLAALGIWLRWPGLFTEGFHNEDAAGITYNADLLRHGLVPLVDSHELKAPGSFFLSYLAWGMLGRSISALQQVACGWALLAALAMWAGGRLLAGARGGFAAGLLYTVCAPITDSIDINYIAWMITPYIAGSVACLLALRTGRLRWWFASGALIAISALMKHQGGLVFPLFVWLIVARYLPRPAGWAPAVGRRRGLLALFGGLAAGFATIGLYYLAVGEPGAFIRTFFFSQGGWKYAAQTEIGLEDKLLRLGDGLLGFWAYMAVPSVLAVFAALLTPRGGRLTVRGWFLGGHLLCSFAGAAIGFRFFKGYYLQILPVALWLAVLPWGPVLRWLNPAVWRPGRRGWSAALAVVLLAALVPAARGDLRELQQIRAMRRHPVDQDVQRIGRLIRANSTPEDTVWVWGRWAWPAYFHGDRLAPTPYYKVMGVLTSNLTNTWRRPTAQTRFVHGEAEAALMADLRARRPAFIVVSQNEDYRDFKDFRRLLREAYEPFPGFTTRRFTFHVRKDQPLPANPRPKAKAKAALPRLDANRLKLNKPPGPPTLVAPPSGVAPPTLAPASGAAPASAVARPPRVVPASAPLTGAP